MSKSRSGVAVAGGCLALILWVAFYLAIVSGLVWLVTTIIVGVIE